MTDGREFTTKLIELYRDQVVLWDNNNENYTNKYVRMVALRSMCQELRSLQPNFSVEKLKKKINVLRTNFNKVRRNRNNVPDDEFCLHLWYYDQMTFLNEVKPHEPKLSSKVSKPKLARINLLPNLKRENISIISEASQSSSMIKKPTMDEDLQAKCWAMKLRKLAPDQKLFAEKIINDTLFEAELGTLTRHGVSFNNTDKTVVWTPYNAGLSSPIHKEPDALSDNADSL